MAFRKLSSVIIIPMLCFVWSANGQHNNTMYYMGSLPQSVMLNPAKQFRCNVFVGFPALSSIYFNLDNNALNYDDIIFKGTGEFADSLITFLHPSYNLDLFLNKLPERGIFSQEFNLELFTFGFRARNLYFSFNLQDRLYAKVSFPKDLLTLMLKGNAQFVGESADFSNLAVEASYYREYGLAVSRKFGDRLTVGIRPKILFGKVNLSTESSPSIGLYTDPETYNLLLQSRVTLNVSAPIEVYTNAESKIDSIELIDLEEDEIIDQLLSRENYGLGIDVGIEYKLADWFTLSASMIDLGYIKWKENTYSFSQDGEYEFTGLDVSSAMVINGDFDPGDEAETILDTLETIFDLQSTDNSYTSYLITKFYLGGEFTLTDNFSVGLLSRSELYAGKIRQSFTFSANTFLAKFLSLSASYSIMNNTYDNLGVGLGIKGALFQFYLVTDKIPLSLNEIVTEDNDIYPVPSSIQTINFRFGLNLLFGCKQKRLKDRPLVQ